MSKPLVMYVVSETSYDITSGKFLFGAEMLRRAGMDVLVLTWHREAFAHAKEKQFFCASPQVEEVALNNEGRIEASKEAWELLQWPISEQKDAPTWARLLALDDVLGAVQGWQLGNLDVLKPDVVVKACQGAESSTPHDEQMELALGRWTVVNQIPVVALEVQRVDNVLAMKWPVRVALTRQEGVGVPWAQECWQLPPAHRYIASVGADPVLEACLEREPWMKEQLRVEGRKLLFMPFHLYYVKECMETLRELGRVIREPEAWRLVVGCGEAFRRSYKERDIIDRGMRQAWAAFEDVVIAENIDMAGALAAADVVVAPYRSSIIQTLGQRWGLEVWQVGMSWSETMEGVMRRKGLVQAVREVCSAVE